LDQGHLDDSAAPRHAHEDQGEIPRTRTHTHLHTHFGLRARPGEAVAWPCGLEARSRALNPGPPAPVLLGLMPRASSLKPLASQKPHLTYTPLTNRGTELRKICNHPLISFRPDEAWGGGPQARQHSRHAHSSQQTRSSATLPSAQLPVQSSPASPSAHYTSKERNTYARFQACVKGALASKGHPTHSLSLCRPRDSRGFPRSTYQEPAHCIPTLRIGRHAAPCLAARSACRAYSRS
jgi:hypothetical protein